MTEKIFYVLLLVTIVISTNSYADTVDLQRESELNDSHQILEKSRRVSGDLNLGATEWEARGEDMRQSAVRDNSIGNGQGPDSDDFDIASEPAPPIFFPKDLAERTDSNIKSDKRRIAEIKADGIISADEVSDYEAIKTESVFAGNHELPVIMNQMSEIEPNNTCDSAQVIACGDTVTCASLGFSADEKDYFSFTLTQTMEVVIETYPIAADECGPGTSAHEDTYLFLTNSTCTDTLAENDDIGGDPYSLYSRIPITLDPGTYVILSENVWQDTGYYHMSLSCTPIVSCTQDSITIEIMTDEYGDETTWKVFEAGTSNAVDSGGPYLGYMLYTEKVCIPSDSCYDFMIFDAYGDGICCDFGIGYFKVYYNGALVDSGGTFFDTDTVASIGGGCAGLTGRCCYGSNPNNPQCVDNVTLDDCISIYSGSWIAGLNCTDDPCPTSTGNDCSEPIMVYLPAQLPYADLDQHTCGRGNDYGGMGQCLNNYGNGADIIYQFNVTTEGWYNFEFYANGDVFVGMSFGTDCPPSDCIFTLLIAIDLPRNETVFLPVGTYYSMISSWPGTGPNCIQSFDLNVTAAPPPPTGDVCEIPIEIPGNPVGYTDTRNSGDFSHDYGYGGEDVVYSFDVTTTTHLEFSLCNSADDYNSLLWLYNGDDCGGSSLVYSNYGTCNNGTGHAKLDYECTPGSYALIVDGAGFAPNDGLYTLEITDYAAVCSDTGYIPPNDDCADVTPVTLAWDIPQTFTGDNCNATIECTNLSPAFSHVWEAFTITQPSMVTLDYCGTSTVWSNSYLVLAYGCPCDSVTYNASYDYTCTDGNIEMVWFNLPAGTYYYPVMLDPASGAEGPYNINVMATQPPVHPANDLCEDAITISTPSNTSGTTLYATVDDVPVCNSTTVTAPGVWYKVAGTGNTMTASTCNSYTAYDTKISVYCSDCGDLICQNADNDDCFSYPWRSTVSWCSELGIDYLILVHGNMYEMGDFQLDISDDGTPCTDPISCIECIVSCPQNGVPEGEPQCSDEYDDTYNGGCNSIVPVFQAIADGDTICGESGTFIAGGQNTRDTDWYEIVLTGEATLSWTVVAEYQHQIVIIDGTEGCDDYIPLVDTSGGECDTLNVTVAVFPGTYWFWAGPSVHTGIPCGSPYTAWLEVGPPPTGACCVDMVCVGTNIRSQCDSLFGAWYIGEDCASFTCPEPSYCQPCLDDNSGEYITNVTFNSIDNTTGQESDTCGYGDYTQISTNVVQDQIYDLTVTVYSGGQWNEEVRAWFDWNRNYILESDESYYLGSGIDPVLTVPITIPIESYVGSIRMRVMNVYDLDPGASGACGAFSFGESEDYSIVIEPGGGCDYVVGDVNGSDSYNGLDITFGVAFFKGGNLPTCNECPVCSDWHYCGDVNGSCTYNGLDITYGVAYFKGGVAPIPCIDCPPIEITTSINRNLEKKENSIPKPDFNSKY